MNPFEAFKLSLLKNVIVMNKKFTFNPTKSIKTLDKVDILVDSLEAVENVKLSEFDGVKTDLERGLSLKQAIKNEIESWDKEIIDILVSKYIELIQKQEPINFDKLEDLRIYWKIRKIFSKEEVDNFSELDWQWATYNVFKDEQELDEFDTRKLEKRKPWYNTELYNHINKLKKQEEKEKEDNKALIKKLLEGNSELKDVDFDIVEAEENDIPTIIEEN